MKKLLDSVKTFEAMKDMFVPVHVKDGLLLVIAKKGKIEMKFSNSKSSHLFGDNILLMPKCWWL